MDHDDLAQWSARAAEWARDYHAGLRDRPVRPSVVPGSIRAALPAAAPETAEPMEEIFADFERLVPDNMTHWQHPRFFAYFPSNAAPASMLAEQLANAISAMCMLWQTSPAATEIEEVMMVWLRDALGLGDHFTGTIHDSATTATFCAVLTMREIALDWSGNTAGIAAGPRLRIYASDQTHSSVDKAVRMAGIGQENLVKVATRDDLSMDPEALRAAIAADRAAGFRPAGVVLCSGGTSVGAFDDIAACLGVAKSENLYTHVDAAWAGNAMICPEFRYLWDDVNAADSVVFNPYKGLGAQFDGAVQFLADPRPQVRTMGLRPDYLETLEGGAVTDFNEWTLPLGRRFRALKLWFVLRAYGLEGLREMIRNHVAWVAELRDLVAAIGELEVVTEPRLALFTFAHRGGDDATADLIRAVNRDGRIYLTQTRHKGRFLIRMTAGSFACTRDDVMMVETVLREMLA
jgi:aromatic-L-amino-acid/L-tryptophan decarboxylase